MITKPDLVTSFAYFLLVIFGEVVLYFASEDHLVANEYAMPATILVFAVIAWLLKTNFKTFLIVAVLMLLYGLIAFFTKLPIYSAEYPPGFADFASVILIKTLFYTLPLLLLVAIKPRAK